MTLPLHSQVRFIKNTVGEYSPVPIGSVGEVIYQINDDYEVLFECGYCGFYNITELEVLDD